MGRWLLLVAGAVLAQVALGGITRLTDSGLSITEWKPILGVIPPTDAAGWDEAFAKYRQIPQFEKVNAHLTLEAFKRIYFWEWFHRLWGRLLGAFFLVPLAIFWRRGQLDGLKGKLLGLLALGGAQGVMGWVMVASGLQELVYVSHLRLAAHFLLAAVLLLALVWMGLGLLRPGAQVPAHVSRLTSLLLAALFVQFAWGAFMAGLKAAPVAPTWPTINGQWLPWAIFEAGGGWWWNDPLAVHVVHRGLAYALVVAIGVWWWATRRSLGAQRHLVLGLVVAQVALGALTVTQALIPGRLLVLGVAHQLVGLVLMVSLVVALRSARAPSEDRGPVGEAVVPAS